MAVVEFLLGRPGSGKSLAAQYIEELLDLKTHDSRKLELPHAGSTLARDWQVEHITDYRFLQKMFLSEGEATGRFKATKHGGFDVVDFSILNTVLEMVYREVCQQLGDQSKLILVEFARDNYSDIQQIFKKIYFDAHFLYFEANIETCIQRVKTRAERRETINDNFVSEEIMREQRVKTRAERRETINDNFVSEEIMREYYRADYSNVWLEGKNNKVEIIQNDGTKEEFGDKIQKFLENFLRKMESESALLSPV